MKETNNRRPTVENVRTALDEATLWCSVRHQMEDQDRAGDVEGKAVDAKIRLAELMANAPVDVLRMVLGNGKPETDRNPS